jgi:hypothetical protein
MGLLPYHEALTVPEKLVQYAADTNDHTASVISRIRTRGGASELPKSECEEVPLG